MILNDPWELIDTLAAEGIELRLKSRECANVFVAPGQEQRYWSHWQAIIVEHAGPLFAVLSGQAVRIDTPRPRPLCGKFRPKAKRATKPTKARGPHGAGPAPRGAA